MSILKTDDDTKTISFARGDSHTISVTLTDAETGAAIDLTGKTVTLTVNSDLNPTDITNQLFSLTGVLDVDPTTGKVSFLPSSADTDQTPATYYYDIQIVEGTEIITPIKANFIIEQDITK